MLTGDLIRDNTFPDLPDFAEFYEMIHGKKPSGEAFEAWKTFFVAGFPAQKMVFLPKGTKINTINAYVKAFGKIFK